MFRWLSVVLIEFLLVMLSLFVLWDRVVMVLFWVCRVVVSVVLMLLFVLMIRVGIGVVLLVCLLVMWVGV